MPPAARCVTRVAPARSRDLIAAIPQPTGAVCFVTERGGLVGWGIHAAITVTGADAAAQIERWYSRRLARLDVVDEVRAVGSGPVCFVSLGFGPADPSVAIIPKVVLGSGGDGEAAFTTTIGTDPGPSEREPVTAPGQVRYADAGLSTTGFTSAVATAVRRIRAGEAAKVVLAHGLTAMTEFAVDERFLLARLAERYPTCATFAVDGLIGASPEMLIRRRGMQITSRVLAGTAWPERGGIGGSRPTGAVPIDAADGSRRVAADLLASGKDLAEHAYAVQSVADALAGITARLEVPAIPAALELANLTHLATDITGELAAPDGSVVASGGGGGGTAGMALSALALAARLHPSAAVGGTPTETARAMIAELEPEPRGRYAAPVGYLDARGDGEFAIALRCATVRDRSVRLMAGCGIVADSDPDTEAREAQIKMVPVRDALEGG